MKYYLINGKIEDFEIEIQYNDTVIELSNEQIAFKNANPTATVSEIIAMQLTPAPVLTNEIIQKNRENAYKMRSDSYFIASQKYLALGNTAKSEEFKALWLAEVAQIDLENPYITN